MELMDGVLEMTVHSVTRRQLPGEGRQIREDCAHPDGKTDDKPALERRETRVARP